MRYEPNDKWARKAKEENFRARSVYKLEELDKRFKLIRSGMNILDIGAAPGSWLQYVSRKVGPKGKALGLDLTPIEPIASNVKTYECDILDDEQLRAILDTEKIETVDLILSDIAPKTSGVKDVDQWRSIELNQSILGIAINHLKKGGTCVMKVFRGADFDEFFKEVKQEFGLVKVAHVSATRAGSMEVYVVAMKKR